MRAELSWATTDADKEAVYRLRYRINVEEQGFFKNEADHARHRLTDAVDASSRIVVAKIGDRVVGTVRLQWGGEARFSEAIRREYELGRFDGVTDDSGIIVSARIMVLSECRGQGLAVRLLEKIFEFAAEQGVDVIVGRSELELVDYYRKFGYRAYGDIFHHPTNGPRMRFAALTADFEYLRGIDSPMFEVLSRRQQEVRNLVELRAALAARWSDPEPMEIPSFDLATPWGAIGWSDCSPDFNSASTRVRPL